MSTCEKCWIDANRVALFSGSNVSDEYRRLLDERRGKRRCTPEEQAGPDATVCDACGRRSRHQFTGECMNCGDWPEKGFHPNSAEQREPK